MAIEKIRVLMLKGDKGDDGDAGDYSTLSNRPSVNGVTINGALTSGDLGLVGEIEAAAIRSDVDAIRNGYLPLTGGTLSGNLQMPNGYAYAPDGVTYSKMLTKIDDDAPNGNRIFNVPNLTRNDVGASGSGLTDANSYQAWLKYICSTYGSQIESNRLVIGFYVAGGAAMIQGLIYDPLTVDSDGLPQYSSFTVVPYDYTIPSMRFGTNNYTFFFSTSTTYDMYYKTLWSSQTKLDSAGDTATLSDSYSNYQFLLLVYKTNSEILTDLIPTSYLPSKVYKSSMQGAWNASTNAFTYNTNIGLYISNDTSVSVFEANYNNSGLTLGLIAVYGLVGQF